MKKNIKFMSFVLVNILIINNIIYAKDYNPASHIYKQRDSALLAKLNDNIIEFDEIDDLVNMNNATVRNNWNKYESNKDRNDVYNDYMDAYSSLNDLASSADSDVQAAMYRAQADAMRINADNSVNDSTITFLGYLITEKNIVLSTQKMFINHYKNLYEQQKANLTVNENQRQYSAAKNNYDNGNLTRVEYLQKYKALKDAQSDLILQESTVLNNKRNLIINCGKSIVDDIQIAPIKLDANNIISQINLSSDMEKAVNENYQYEIYKRQLENSNSKEMKNQNQIYVSSAPNFIHSDIEKKYNDLNDSITSLSVYRISYDYNVENEKAASNEYSNGQISKKEYQTAVCDKEISRINVEIAKLDILSSYITYLSSVNGLASAGS